MEEGGGESGQRERAGVENLGGSIEVLTVGIYEEG